MKTKLRNFFLRFKSRSKVKAANSLSWQDLQAEDLPENGQNEKRGEN